MSSVDVDLMLKMYELAYMIRRFELRATEQYRLGHIRGYLHVYTGEEAIAVGAISALEPGDYIVSTHRGHGHALAKGHDPRLMFAELFGKVTGYCKGRGGSMHISNLGQGNLGANGIVGGGLPIGTGAAMTVKLKGARQVVLCFFGDGAANNGVFHESINMAAIYRLPVIYILENNHFAVSTPVEYSTPIPDIATRAAGYGIPGVVVDGNDAVLVYEVVSEAITRARLGTGPSLIECKTYRHGGHHVNDPGSYMPKEKQVYWKSKDPIGVLKARLLESGVDEARVEAINNRVESVLTEAIQFALESLEPSVQALLGDIPEF
jgi:TPP-dependent pyruvate/acetoin dehydrogenase alpha subunit